MHDVCGCSLDGRPRGPACKPVLYPVPYLPPGEGSLANRCTIIAKVPALGKSTAKHYFWPSLRGAAFVRRIPIWFSNGSTAIGSGPERYWLGCVAVGAEAVCGTSSRRNSRLLPERRCARRFVNGGSAKGLGAARMRKRIGLRAIVGDLFLQRIGKHEAIAAESLGVIKGCIRSRDDLGQQALA